MENRFKTKSPQIALSFAFGSSMIMHHLMIIFILWSTYTVGQVPKCEEPPDIDFGERVNDGKAEYHEGDKVWYQCSPGATLLGSEWIECHDKNWTPLPKCSGPCIITRQQLEEKKLFLSNGKRRSVIILSDQSLGFSCADGYTFTTPSLKTCVDGQMDFPSCISEELRKCGAPPVISNGDITSFPLYEYAPESTVEYRCQRFYVLEGSPIVTCRNGEWTKEPKCLEACTISEEMMKSHKIKFKWISTQKLYAKTEEETEFQCIWGFHPAPRSPPFRARCIEGQIQYPRCI